ncbi:MAG: S8 family peptidase [Bacteroidota bacterium]|nr:S8 family peptidase [Bacteroidota bacterium]
MLVAVIDGGVDTAHEDLKAVIWNNPRELVNGLDDDHNGYADDLHGWDFIGGPRGDIQYENLELTRLIRKEPKAYDSVPDTELPAKYRKMKEAYDKQVLEAQKMVSGVGRFSEVLDSITRQIGKENPSVEDFEHYQPTDNHEKRVKELVLNQLQENPDFSAFKKDINNTLDHFKTEIQYHLNLDYTPRSVVGDDVRDSVQKNYGNNDVTGPDAHHGTHVSGIIGAVRNNRIGINGVANHVQIMSVRVVPDGDERDKDVANGIRYATDNGAKVINMSFGKGYSPQKSVVDEAVKYAMSKDVLIVHAAGNEGVNLDSSDNFPTRRYEQGGEAGAWIEVGASDKKDDSALVANFSNYGKTSVDVFAPGVQIYSSTPGSQYEYYSGTSMASPVVAGLAALIREYYPKLTALQVKDIILRSVTPVHHKVVVKDGKGNEEQVPFSDICVSGGIVNAYNALLLAKHYKKSR